MKMNQILFVVASASLFVGCAAVVPQELARAREAFKQASAGDAAKVAPAELHVASQALAKAEKSFKDTEGSFQTKDLAYVAQRKAELADATAAIATAQKNQAAAKAEFQVAQGTIIEKQKKAQADTNNALAESERAGEATQEKLAAEKAARAAAEKRAADALAALAKMAAVKEEPRGTVITLSGSVLFASNQSILLPEAQARLDDVVAVLMATAERNVVIEGHTDSQGGSNFNMDLSQSRADAVRAYLVRGGYLADRIKAHGLGEGHPVADNGNPEGRANNRRVEIIIEPAARAAK